jgi:hypothetical protein
VGPGLWPQKPALKTVEGYESVNDSIDFWRFGDWDFGMGKTTVSEPGKRVELDSLCRTADNRSMDVESHFADDSGRDLGKDNMTMKWWHIAGLVIVGILIDYFFPNLANMTVAKLTPRKS